MKKEDLIKQLKQASDAYYNTGTPIMSDSEFDTKLEQLKQMDPDNLFLKTVGTPPIGTVLEHAIQMGSQEKLKDRHEFDGWVEKIESYDHKNIVKYLVQYKLDGSSVALYYKNGKLTHALTRGDGIKGEVVTSNVLLMQNVKHEIPGFTGSLRGEIILRKEVFEKYLKPLGHKNPRNTAAGLVRNQKETDLQKHLEVVYYDIENGEEYEQEVDRLTKIRSFGLSHVTSQLIISSDMVWNYHKELELKRNEIDYEIDGIIVRANSLKIQKDMGMSSHMCPKGQRCVKFTSNKAQTVLKDIIITIAHTGAMVPSGVLEPVDIGGVTISNVLLNNYDYIEQLGLTMGCTICIERAGDVIPHVVGKINDASPAVPIIPPTHCISCQSELVKDGVYHKCMNEECDGVQIRKVKSWITKRNIKFIGDSLLEELYANHGVTEPHHLYGLTVDYLSKVNRGAGVVGTLAKSIVAEIDKSRECSVSDMLGSVCIKFLGRRQVDIIIEASKGKISTINDFLSLTVDQLLALPGFKDSKATGIVEGIAKAKPTIEALLAAGVKISENAAIDPNFIQDLPTTGKLHGMSFCFTGAINKTDDSGKRFTRNMMWDVVKNHGGTVLEEVKLVGVAHLVQADPSSSSSKTKKAEKLGVKIISEEEFWKMVE